MRVENQTFVACLRSMGRGVRGGLDSSQCAPPPPPFPPSLGGARVGQHGRCHRARASHVDEHLPTSSLVGFVLRRLDPNALGQLRPEALLVQQRRLAAWLG